MFTHACTIQVFCLGLTEQWSRDASASYTNFGGYVTADVITFGCNAEQLALATQRLPCLVVTLILAN
ncbi:hypothetical protein [Mangrovibacter sp. MFB070]|uniref:hypothetical protein n=1 Tax=Mangrovibacter sp. MFB070 TaxID=1224318 RepID=UPI001F1D4F59|nr:hypothetical protein [Mangrovibacter sp. MFB070]